MIIFIADHKQFKLYVYTIPQTTQQKLIRNPEIIITNSPNVIAYTQSPTPQAEKIIILKVIFINVFKRFVYPITPTAQQTLINKLMIINLSNL